MGGVTSPFQAIVLCKGSDNISSKIISSEDRFVIDTMVWSFSRLSSYHQCPYGFYLKYVQCTEGEPNFFGQYGSFIHKILEMYAKGELSLFEISPYYEEHFWENVTCDAPPNKYVDIRQSYYDKGLDYLDNIDLMLDKYEILGIEKEVKFVIGGYEMLGYIDLLLRDKETGDITVLDHKSASIKFCKNGRVSKKDEEHIQSFKRQLYLYSKAIIEEYGVEPKYLSWNLFKEQKWYTIDFDKAEYDEAVQWAEDTVKMIESDTTWRPNPSSYFCWHICDMRNCACEYKPS